MLERLISLFRRRPVSQADQLQANFILAARHLGSSGIILGDPQSPGRPIPASLFERIRSATGFRQ